MNRYVGFFRFYTSNNLERTIPYATEAEALSEVEARMTTDNSVMEGYVVKIMSKSIRQSTIVTTDFGA